MITTTNTKRIAVAGNPNTGKSSLFNRLTGLNQKVGNYPGITVERAEGRIQLDVGPVELVDVPGAYSLSARSPEEHIAIQAIAGLPPLPRPDAVVVVVDATQLGRNLYLALQILELGIPTVIALNMSDSLASRGLAIDVDAMGAVLGAEVVATSGRTGAGLAELRAALGRALSAGSPSPAAWSERGDALAEDVAAVAQALPAEWRDSGARSEALARWALLSIDDEDELVDVPPALRARVQERHRLANTNERRIEDEIIGKRYAWIDEVLPSFLHAKQAPTADWTDRVDRWLLHPLFGFALFLLAMGLVFQSLFSWADPAIGAVEALIGGLKGGLRALLPAGFVTDLVIDGIVEGVGAVVVFLPQILLLFFFIGLMEDSGYMARVAFLMDRVMKSLGLHGRAFVPMMSGFACAVPAIMATRTMERRRDRLMTMMVVPLMTCSARLPVYTLIIAALFSPEDRLFGFLPTQGSLMIGMYLFSTLIALAAAWILGRTLLRGPRVPLILEMPPYRLPRLGSVIRQMWLRTRIFVTEAGTVILVCTVAMWALLSFPEEPELDTDYDARRAQVQAEVPSLGSVELDARLAALASDEEGARIRASYGGRLGQLIEPAIAPIGFDWKIGIGVIGAFAAREVFVSTMGIVYGLGEDEDEESSSLRERIRAERGPDGEPVYTPLVGLSLMAFFALACQCMSTLAVVRRETQSWAWTAFLFAYMTALAWIASFAIYQGGRLLGFE